jgi:hypothetical protein
MSTTPDHAAERLRLAEEVSSQQTRDILARLPIEDARSWIARHRALVNTAPGCYALDPKLYQRELLRLTPESERLPCSR